MFIKMMTSPNYFHFTKEKDNMTIEVPKVDNDGKSISPFLARKIAMRKCLC